jgi:arginase
LSVVTLIGAPWDGSSSYQRGAAAAPAAIRAALWSESSNSWNEQGDDLRDPEIFQDTGDLTLSEHPAAAREAIERRVREVVLAGGRPLVLGGDHSITYPVVRGLDQLASIVHFDAHADLYSRYPPDGSVTTGEERYSHACPFARIMEEKLARRLIQIGVRTLTAHQREQVSRFGVEVIGAVGWHDALPLVSALTGPVYISIDLDALEPMLAPGVAHPEPGGLTVREVLEVLTCIRGTVVGADVVEYNPSLDMRDLTARVAAKFVKELTARLHR